MKNWSVKSGQIIFVCLQQRNSLEVPPIGLEDAEASLEPVAETGWLEGSLQVGSRNFAVNAYRSRAVVSTSIAREHSSVTGFIEDEFLAVRTVFESEVLPKLPLSSGSDGLVWYPVIYIPRLINSAPASTADTEWLGDGIASFNYRVFDSRVARAGHVRVSRFSTVCIGVGPQIVQDVINLVYERILYPARLTGEMLPHGEAEQAMASGLSQYTVPTELNVYMQRLAFSIATYALLFGVTFAAVPLLIPDGTPTIAVVLIVLGAFGASWLVARLLNYLRSRRW